MAAQTLADALRPFIGQWVAIRGAGALRTRMLTPLAGIELTGTPTERFYVGGIETTRALARVTLTITDGASEFSWDAPVWFCDP